MPAFNTKLKIALQSADDIEVQLPGDGTKYHVECNFDVNDQLPDGTMILYPVVMSLEGNSEDLLLDDADVTVNNGVVRVSDRKGRPLIMMLQSKKPLGQNDLIVKNA